MPSISSEDEAPPADLRPSALGRSEPLARRFWFGLLFATFLASAFLVLLGIPRGLGLVEADEGRYADIPAEMAKSGDWVTPRLDGVRYFEKPPLFYWLGAATMRILGPTVDAARLPTRIVSLATTLLVALAVGRLTGSRRGALYAGALYLSSLMPAILAKIISIDALLAIATTGTTILLALAIEREGRGKRLTLDV